MQWRSHLWLGPFLALLLLFIGALQWNYPLIGHDYHYIFPRMIAGWWHLAHEGLWPYRYAVHFCGGLPQYGNPHDLFYSLPQFLSFFLDLWTVVLVTQAAILIIGYAGWYRFGRDVLGLVPTWAHVLAIVILTNGFLLMHALVGHLSYQTMPLIGWILWFLLGREHLPLSSLLHRSAAFGLLVLIILHASGYFTLMLAMITYLMLVPFDLLLSEIPLRERLPELVRRLTLGGAFALLLSGSKLVAVWSVMRYLPRHIPFITLSPNVSTALFILKALFALPQTPGLFPHADYDADAFEKSMLVSPVVLLGITVVLKQWTGRLRSHPVRFIVMAGWSVLIGIVFVSILRGEGLVAGTLHRLPLFASLRNGARFLYVLTLLLSCAGVFGLERLSSTLPHWDRKLACTASILTLLTFVLGNAPMLRSQILSLTLYYDEVQVDLEKSEALRMGPVTSVLDEENLSDFTYVLSASTGARCYEPLLSTDSLPDHLIAGPVETVRDGAFNLYNPACFAYPEENDCRPGDRITTADRANFEAFRSGQPVTWKISTFQRTADIVTIVGILLCLALLVFPLAKRAIAGVSA